MLFPKNIKSQLISLKSDHKIVSFQNQIICVLVGPQTSKIEALFYFFIFLFFLVYFIFFFNFILFLNFT